MTFQVTTVYPDGRQEVRDATPQEIAQRQADIERFEVERADRERQLAERENAKASAQSKLAALGLTDAEIAAIIGG